jgi:hypothetical protein
MVTGAIQLSAFEYRVHDGEVGEGENKSAVKVVMIKDKHSGLQIHLILKPDELTTMAGTFLDSRIVPASIIPQA